MSVADALGTGRELATSDVPVARVVATAGVAALLGAYLSVLHRVLVVMGDPVQLYFVVGAAAVAATALARFIRPRTAALVAVGAVAAGTYAYVTSLPGGFGFLVLVAPMVDDAVALLGGLSLLRIVNADVWALSAAPAPVFLASYLALRRRYVAASAVGVVALGIVVLTGDASIAVTLFGVAGVTVAVAAGDCDRRGEALRNADGLAVILAAMVLATLFLGVVPGAAGSFVSTEGVGSETGTMESSLVHAGESMGVAGAVELSPEVRYTVRADRPAYWRVATYDRYTGDGWVRSGDPQSYEDDLPRPPGRTRTLAQEYTAETTIATLPAANQPTSISESPVPVRVTEGGAFQPAAPLQPGESYRVTSSEVVTSSSELRTAGTHYSDRIEARYTQLPDSTPDRVAERTDRLTANADNPYDTARVVEHWLRNNYGYSLDVDRPRGDVADAFLFEREAGYCTYFATTMVAMLRTQGVPARMAVGYTPGQQVDDDEWVVRGLNSHAWVEVYFPGHGWVEFDPTPADPREATERQTLQEAREDGPDDAVDTDESRNASFDRGTPSAPGEEFGDDGAVGTPAPADVDQGGDDGFSLPTPRLPTREQAGLGLLVLAGLVAGARRSGLTARARRSVWLRRLPEGDPEAVVAAAYHRVVYLEERAGRRKRPGETPRQFLAEADERARRVGELYERARYGHGVDGADAGEAAGHLAALLEERSRLPHLVRKGPTAPDSV